MIDFKLSICQKVLDIKTNLMYDLIEKSELYLNIYTLTYGVCMVTRIFVLLNEYIIC